MKKHRTVLVTGGCSGIGLAIVRLLAAEDWHVVAFDRDEAALASTRETFAGNAGVTVCALDVTDEVAVARVVEQASRETPPIKALINSAGIGTEASFMGTTTALLRRTFEVNVLGTLLVAQAAVLAMKANGSGAIVNISSISGMTGIAGRTAYGATKSAIINMTKVMALELATNGIRVNAIAPGPIDTPLVAALHTQTFRAEYTSLVPQRRYGKPEDIAHAVSFLIDDERAGYITGQTLAVDGGFTTTGLMADHTS